MKHGWRLSVALLLLVACGPRPPDTPGRFGEVTSAVIIVNPVINQGSTTSVTSGSARGNVEVRAGNLPAVRTDTTGLALVEELPTGTVPLQFDSGKVDLQVVRAKELYDVVVSYQGSGVQTIIPPVRYPIGGQVVVVEPGGSIASAASSDGAILFLKPGTYPGNFELRAEGILIFGAWSLKDGPLSIIDGDVTVLGGNIRMRGVKVNGKVTSNANSFSMAFSDIGTANITGNGVSLLRNRFTGQAIVPSSSAVLVDNQGIP